MIYNFQWFIAGCLIIGGVLFTGCATVESNQAGEKLLLIECVASKDAHVSMAYAYEDANELEIYGKVKRNSGNCCDSVRGHVDIMVVGPDGTVFDVVSALYSPRNIPKVRTRTSQFKVRLPYTLPYNASIRAIYHNSLKAVDSSAYTNSIFACGQSMAIPGGQG